MADALVLERALERERTVRRICAALNGFTDLRETLLTVVRELAALTGCEGVAIRLLDAGDYPYFAYDGFADEFIEMETSLCSLDGVGERIPEADGESYRLDCLCGCVIRGRSGTSEVLTERGSFWSNDTGPLLAQAGQLDLGAPVRGHCLTLGYRSLAMVPILSGERRVGLIQLRDPRPDCFTPELVEFVEMIGEQIGLAVANALAYTRLREALEEVRRLRGILPICARCKRIRDGEGYWAEVEEYFREHAEVDFTHGLCDGCLAAAREQFERTIGGTS